MDEQARRDLEMVRRLMVDARGVETAHGPHLVLWGGLMAIALMLTWAAATGAAVPGPGWTWGVALTLGWAGSAGLSVRAGRRQGRTTPGGRMLGSVWLAAGVTLTVVGLAGLFVEGVPARLLPGLTSVILGGVYWATSTVTGRAAERWLGAAWWLGGAALLVWSETTWTLPVQAVLVLLLEVVPGIVLMRSARRAEPVLEAAALP